MKHFLIAVDIQKDFVNGALGTKEAVAMIPAAVEKLKSFDGEIFVTLDTHFADYLQTAEGRKLPVPHCIKDTEGWQLDKAVAAALADREYTAVEKHTFGAKNLPELIERAAAGEDFDLEVIGLCTDICVISNAMLVKAALPEVPVVVDAACCAGVTPESHRNALAAMKVCQIEIENE